MTSLNSVHRLAILGLLLANLLWGLSFPLIKGLALTQQQLLPGSSTWFITGMSVAPRFLLAAAVLVIFARRHLAHLSRSEVWQGAQLGLACALGLLLQVDGLQFTSATVSAFLTQFYAIMIPVVLALRHRRLPPPRVWLCVVLVLAGVMVLGRFDLRTFTLGRGEVETLLGSVFFMWQIFVLGDPRYAANRPLPVSTVMFVVTGLLMLLLALVAAPHPAAGLVPWSSGPWLGFTAVLTVCCTLGAFLLMVKWQPKITPTEAGLIYCFEPVFASLIALFLPALLSRWAGFDYVNETVTWQLLVGGGLISVANVLLQFSPPTAAKP